jgi:beta-galactosidase
LHTALRFRPVRFSACLLLGMGLISPLRGQEASAVFIDASAPVAAPKPVEAQLGTAKRPDGETLTVNSQYLVLNGKPWLPVMGEFHYSRYPEQEWETEILKMKAAGVQIVATYIFWIHHEEVEGQFDWSGQRDLRHFVDLCAKHGLYVYPRIGPWAHGEVRNGGLPDWVVKNGPTRRNDPAYLAEVQTLYSQIGEQLKGTLWKDGGPVIGIQLENEYHETGPGAGAEHIEKLKQLAVAAGLDVPLYTITGWDGAAVPLGAALPVFGGYPAAPWSREPGPMRPSEVYAFRFANRVAGNMGTIGGSGQNASAAYRGTPFLTAEVGGGIEDTYFRRPVLTADDIAAMAPVMIGSGANLLGFYMFHGGRNPEGRLSTLQESQLTGYPTDVPVKSYDFQAPLGEFGEERESLKRLKLMNYFLNDFGSQLAPMQVYSPSQQPSSPSDLAVPRVAARADAEHAFVFFNNYVRNLAMPPRADFQVHLKLGRETVNIPSRPIEVPPGAYGIWPVNMDIGGYKLVYSTAQPFKLFRSKGDSYYFFFGIPDIASELAVAGTQKPSSVSNGVSTNVRDGVTYFKLTETAQREEITLGEAGHSVHLIVMPRAEAENLWNVDGNLNGSNHLLLTAAQFYSDNDRLYFHSDGNPDFAFSLFGEPAHVEAKSPLKREEAGLFTNYSAHLEPVSFHVDPVLIKQAGMRGPLQYGPPVSWSKGLAPIAPNDEDFKKTAAVWQIKVPTHCPEDVSNVFLKIDYRGDVARLYSGDRLSGDRLLDDNFWNGNVWQLGLKEIGAEAAGGTLQLSILPLPASYPMYLERAATNPSAAANASGLKGATLVPQYQLVVDLKK